MYLTIKAEHEPITQDHLVLNTDAGEAEEYLAVAYWTTSTAAT